MEKVYEIYIKATPARVWEAITDPDIRAKYNFGVAVQSGWEPGARLEMVHPVGGLLGEGTVVEIDPPRRLVHTFAALWDDEVRREETSRVTWEIDTVGDSCCLRLIHDELADGASSQLYGGWPMILSGLKTFLETGQLLTTPGSLRYATDAVEA